MVFPKYNSLVFINGCFWHGHNRCQPWRARDRKNYKILSSNWRILIIWECSLKGKHKIIFDELINDVILWLQSEQNNQEITGNKGT